MVRRPALDVLSDVVDTCEAHGGSVQSVEASMEEPEVTARLVVDHELTASTAKTFTPEAASLTEDGDLQVQFRAPSLESLLPSAAPITAEQTETVAVTDEGAIRCTHEFTLDDEGAGEADETVATPENSDKPEPATPTASTNAVADGGARTDTVNTTDGSGSADDGSTETDEHPFAAVRDDSVPPYEDTEYLQALYEACDTFEEMSRHIEMDVVAETVRRYMVDAGIHQPDSYDTSVTSAHEEAESEDEEDTTEQSVATLTDGDHAGEEPPADEELAADGIGLPEGIGVADLVDAVADAATVYEVGRNLGLGQGRTRELLERLGLLDRVVHRVADDHRGPSRDEVVRRIRRHGTA